MRKILALLLLTSAAYGQQIDKVYKVNGVWKGDISGPITTYPKQGVTIADTSAIPDPVVIPPAVLTTIDNADASIVYAGGGWYSGPTTAAGFYPAPPNSTLAYASAAGNTATLIFNGTSVEVYCERKTGTGHGSASLQVDALSAVTVDLNTAGGVSSVFKVENLSPGQHTFKLTVVGGGNVVLDYIKINGSAVTPTPPIDPPPTGSIIVNPGQSIKAAVEAAAAGKTVSIQAGNYSEPNINVPAGVNITGVGSVVITATTPGVSGDAETGLFILRSSSTTQGNQTISNLILEGNNVGYGGILVENRDKVYLRGNTIRNFNFHGIWLRSVKDSEVTDNDLLNTAWASSAYASGQINIYALTNVNILRNKIRSDKDKKGTGIEALWKESTMTNLKINYNTFTLSHLNPWGNYQAKNFSIEIHDTYYNGIEVAYNTFNNQLSMASHKPATAATPGKTIIHHNTGDLGGDTMFIENICDNLEAYDNTVTNAQMYAANFQPNSVWKNNKFYNNTFTSSGAVSWGGFFLIGPLGVQTFTITGNTFKLSGNVKVKYMGTTGGVTESGNTWNP